MTPLLLFAAFLIAVTVLLFAVAPWPITVIWCLAAALLARIAWEDTRV